MAVEYTIPGMLIRDHMVDVPLDWSKPEGETIRVFAREVCDPARRRETLPLLAFLQGGPGGKSPRPSNGGPPWLAEALKTHRVILIDQRGTGRSSRIESATMEHFADGRAAADYLSLFRADSIVADCEHLRKVVFGGGRWQTLGQSYGGFLTLTYLSKAPEGLSACYVTGGLAGLGATADDVYRRTYPRVAEKNAAYYRRYPGDAEPIGRIADYIEANEVRLPDGDRLSVRRFQTIGIDFGMAPGYENIHWLVDEAFSGPNEDRLSDRFLASVLSLTSYDDNPLFAVLQESIYGQAGTPTAWAAERIRAEHPAFAGHRRPLLLTGEMMYPWMFEEIRSLRPFRAGVEALAAYERYEPLYDPARLAANEVPVAAVIYHDDMYVDAGLSLETARHVANVQAWVTNEFEHDGVRQSAAVLRRLITLVREQGGPLAS
ncbi:alpha/beta fold hydrolase [Rhizobium ruizarguesonis]|uniref:alpha/beta fold hydrolase n=1 Tax=Rhizobium ruizarguesonis TaxID=2081791 RepID=UPI0010319AA9|nr:alpha/beta fold hydrolase [Rhizobium ruizarguesonis]TAT71573.1 alpha/beta fold hydrolase [Rhizobium ruizarguesonis]TBD25077.1 alpha/beta fold hydrolase [Rhizobium ruizarguesonis]TBD25960.1 alpha/beta fold hydrolase [Rhizobium ruizarguesonis]TBD34782.1 alpha/beta fold hydrolase [Rhizobium ruizarguesonis]TBD51357.1 alpha/beta fold hydrolase [Rhizobium ruizarguesonis]